MTSGAPLVLATPAFNSAKYLRATLESFNANGDSVRWWLQDGGSTDGTVGIARELAREGDIVVSEKDSGQTDAINRAFTRMGGEIIGYINSDDCLAPGAAERVLKFFAENPEVDLVYGEVDWIDPDGCVTGHHAGRIDSLGEVLNIYDVWWKGRQWVQPEVFFRRSLWERVGPFDTRYHLAFDFEYWVRCFEAGAVVRRIPATLARFRLHPEQKSTQADAAAGEIRRILGEHLRKPLPVAKPVLKRLRLMLEYDLYRNAEAPFNEARPSFLSALVRHPAWLTLPVVRERLLYSILRTKPADRVVWLLQ